MGWIISILLLLSVLPAILSQCIPYPGEWRTGWYFREYNILSATSGYYTQYHNSGYNVGLYSDYQNDAAPTYQLEFRCLSSHTSGDERHYYVKISSEEAYECQLMMTADGGLQDVLLLKRIQPVSAGLNAVQCQQQQQTLPNSAVIHWQYRGMDITPPSTTVQCGVADGTYHVQVGPNGCLGDLASKVVVTGDTMRLDSCVPAQRDLDVPYKASVTCIAKVSGARLDSDNYGEVFLVRVNEDNVYQDRLHCMRMQVINNVRTMVLFKSKELVQCRRHGEYTSEHAATFSLLDMQYTTPNPFATNSPILSTPHPTLATANCQFDSQYEGYEWLYSQNRIVGVEETYTIEFMGYETVVKVNDQVLAVFRCNRQSLNNPRQYLRHLNTNNNQRQCVAYYPTNHPDIILERIADAGLSLIDPDDCQPHLQLHAEEVRALTKQGLDLSSGRCPENIANKQYRAVYLENESDHHLGICSGYATSTMTATATHLEMNLCTNENSYERPYRTSLQCVAHWEEEMLPLTDGRGDYLLLAYRKQPSDAPQYICARYVIDQEEFLKVSMIRSSPDTAFCDIRSTYDTTGSFRGHYYTAYAFQDVNSEYKPPSTTPAPICSERADCSNHGECRVDRDRDGDGTRYCHCDTGHTGHHCETDLPQGSCGECIQENSRGCLPDTDRIYYWCDCKDGYEGQQCQYLRDFCVTTMCENGGTCKNEKNGFKCQCVEGFYGEVCHKTTASSKDKDNEETIIIIVVVVVLAVLIALVVITALAICHVKRRKESKYADDSEVQHTGAGGDEEHPDKPKPDGTGDNYSTANAWYADYKQDGTAPTANSKMELELAAL